MIEEAGGNTAPHHPVITPGSHIYSSPKRRFSIQTPDVGVTVFADSPSPRWSRPALPEGGEEGEATATMIFPFH